MLSNGEVHISRQNPGLIIKQIAVFSGAGEVVFGLGQDNKVYYWDSKAGNWRLNKMTTPTATGQEG